MTSYQDSDPKLTMMKVWELREQLYSDNYFSTHQLETFVKDLIEQKGIVIIDEIDKLVWQQG